MKIGIVGGGITGLTAAYKLSQEDQKVSVFERNANLGGMAACFEVIPGSLLEIFYHHFFSGDREIISLIQELNLGPKIEWLESRMGVFLENKIFPFGTPWDLLKFSPLPLIDRIKFGLATLLLTKIKNWKNFESITAADWLLKKLGEKSFSIFWKPLLTSKFAEDWDKVSMAWFWGKVNLRGASRPGLFEREKLGYLDGSLQLLLDALEKNIREKGGSFLLSTKVTKISKDANSGKIKVTVDQGTEYEFDKVIATTPSPVFYELVPSLEAPYSDLLLKTKYKAAICLVLVLKKSVSPIYWLNVPDTTFPFVGLIEHTNYISKKKYGGYTILYITRYLNQNNELFQAQTKQLISEFMPFIQKINKDFNEDWIKNSYVFKNSHAQPVIGLNYSKQIPDMKTPIENIYLANTTQIYPEDRGVNYSVRLGNQISSIVLSKS